MKAVCDLMEPGQDRLIIFRAKDHTVHLVRCQFIADDFAGKHGVAGQHIAFRKALQQPIGIVLDGIGPSAGI